MTAFSKFNVDFNRRSSPSARCASAANSIVSDTDITNGSSVSVYMINYYFILLVNNSINCLNL